MPSLYDRPDLYDLASPRDPGMERFYSEAARTAGNRVLELACGTGRLAIPLSLSGLEVVGGDLSKPMLEAARAGAVARQSTARFTELDMRRFDLGERFDFIFIAANSLLHLHTETDFADFFASVRRHLAPDGTLAFDIFVPSVRLLASDPTARRPVSSFEHPALGTVRLEETIRYDAVTQISHIEWFWSSSDAPDFWQVPLILRQIFPEELRLLLHVNGYRLTQRFGNFDRSPFGETSWRQVCLATPR
jgi:SAM-dependent methyltransferase